MTTVPKEGLYLGYGQYQRIHCGLRWDPDVEAQTQQIDLDLTYTTYDEYGQHIATVSGKDPSSSDDSGSIYHSGDDNDGTDEADDERITIDLMAISRHIHYIFIAVEIYSKHIFSDIFGSRIRVTKGIENQQLFSVNLSGMENGNSKAFIFIRLDRQPGGWNLNVIDQPLSDLHVPDWEDLLTEYLPHIPEEKKNSADIPVKPKKGDIVPLFYAKKARHRILCGLSWDRSGEGKNIADLDLTCILYDSDGNYIDDVSSEADRSIDGSGAIYHSGDDVTGLGKGDDETISVELLNLPGHVHNVVFVVDMKTNHTMGQILNPEIRIADGMSNRNQLSAKFGNGGDNNAYIFARLLRKDDGWMLHYIGQFIDTATVEDWAEAISPHLKKGHA